jgi:hypothetical protein
MINPLLLIIIALTTYCILLQISVRIYSQGEPPLVCSGAKAASTIPVAEIFVRTLGRYLARKAKYN